MCSSHLCFFVLVWFSSFALAQTDPYLIGGWQSAAGSQGTDYIIFNSDGTFSALFDNAGIYGTYSVNQNQNPWWLDLNIENFNGNNAPSLYSHPLQTPTPGSGQSKQLYLAIPFNRLSIFTGSAQRPSSLVNATLYYSTSSIPSFTTTTTTTTASQTTAFGNSGGTTWTNCPDCQDACHNTCNLAQVGRKRCQKKCQKMLCSKVC
jgi:hypothetical protein